MITSVDDIYQVFFDKLEENKNFFAYYGVSEQEALNLAKERSSSYLREAMVYLRRKTELEFELGVDDYGNFIEPITEDEADLLADIMVMKYLDKKLTKLEPIVNAFAKAEMSLLHSPANERTSFAALVKEKEEDIREAISDYASKERLSSKKRMVDHTIEEGE